jgi:Zn-dependent peptidase ImmA (M78 family)
VNTTMRPLFRNALLKADEVRMQLGLNMFQPINIFDACIELELTVKFVDVNMEGMYISQKDAKYPTILLSNKRPLPRRCYSCAHELGHHAFGHGTTVDALSERNAISKHYDDKELLVDSFAGALLMPIAGIEAAFTKRKWVIQNVSPIDFYTICSTFGVGYNTLIHHCRATQLISGLQADNLEKVTPGKILKTLIGADLQTAYFKIIDKKSKLPAIDLEVSNYIIFPPDVEIEGEHLVKKQLTTVGTAYQAMKPGIVRATTPDGSLNSFIRIQNFQYIGLAEYRHLETLKD